MAAGKKTGGRKSGSVNKLSGLAKDNIAAVFNRLDGTNGMAKWAEENQTQFYQIYAKLLPIDLHHSGEVEHKLTLADVLNSISK
jgi:hypothetical protein